MHCEPKSSKFQKTSQNRITQIWKEIGWGAVLSHIETLFPFSSRKIHLYEIRKNRKILPDHD